MPGRLAETYASTLPQSLVILPLNGSLKWVKNKAHHKADKATQPKRNGLNRMNDAHKNDIPCEPHDEAIDCRIHCRNEQEQNDSE